MMNATVTALPTAKPRRTTKVAKRAPHRSLIALRRQRRVGFVMLFAAAFLSILTVKHMIHGLTFVTGDNYVAIMAVTIEFGYILLEVAKLVLHGQTEQKVQRTLMIMLVGLLLLSAVMNAFAFYLTATEANQYIAMAFGILLPFMVFGFARVGGPMVLAHK